MAGTLKSVMPIMCPDCTQDYDKAQMDDVMTDDDRLTPPPYSPYDKPDAPPPVPFPDAPALGASFLWLTSFAMLFFVAAMLYVMGYSVLLGIEHTVQGGSSASRTLIDEALARHLYSPDGVAGVYITQFVLMFPVVLFAAHFSHQPWQKTLALNPVSMSAIKYWLAVLLVFFALEHVLSQIMDVDYGEFLYSLNGSRHLILSLVVVCLAPLLEEFIFRGYLFTAWRHTRMGLSGTLLLTSVLFTGLHVGQYDGFLIAMVFVLSLLLGLAREKTGSLWVPVILHAANNLVSAITIIYLGML